MTRLPPNWVEATLGAICERPQYGWTTSATTQAPSDAPLRLVRTTDIAKGRPDWGSVPYCEEEPPDPEKYLLAQGDIVISRAGSVGFSYYVDDPPRAVFASYLIRFRPLPDRVDGRYLAYFLRSPLYWKQVLSTASGITIANVNAKKLAAVTIPLAPRYEQEQIVNSVDEQLSRLDAGLSTLRRARRNVTRLRAATLRDLLNTRWPLVTLDEVARVDSGPAFKSKLFRGPGEGVRLLRGDNIQPGSLRWRNERTWPLDLLEGYEHLNVGESDLILAMDRPVISSGLKLAPVRPSDLPALLVQRVARIRPTEQVLTAYLHLALQQPSFVPHLLRGQTGTQIPHITLASIRSFPLPLPPIDQQEALIAQASTRGGQLERAELHIGLAERRAAALEAAILAAAFGSQLEGMADGALLPRTEAPQDDLIAGMRSET